VTPELEKALELVKASGYTVVTNRSYAAAQARLAAARCYLESEQRATRSAEAWAGKALDEQRRLADRLTFVYGVARSHGATVEELRGS